MDALRPVLDWSAGGSRRYMTLDESMRYDTFWVALTVGLALLLMLGVVLMALRWWWHQRTLEADQPAAGLGQMRNLLLAYGIVGFIYIPLQVLWPAWRFYDLMLLALAGYTWFSLLNDGGMLQVCRELRRSQHLAKQLESVQVESRRKSFFLSALGHDLRNPLYGLVLQIEVADNSLRSGRSDQAMHALSLMRQCAHEANGLLEDFLELGRLDWTRDAVNLEVFDGSAALRDLVAVVRPSAESKGLSLEVEAPSALAVETDRSKLDRIASNLLANAIKYTEQGQVTVRLQAKDETLVLEVEDTGPGIPPDKQPHIFEEFYQVQTHRQNRSEGYGLGLTIVKRLTERLGGRIELESQPGEGTRVRMLLPQFPSERSEPTQAVPQSLAI